MNFLFVVDSCRPVLMLLYPLYVWVTWILLRAFHFVYFYVDLFEETFCIYNGTIVFPFFGWVWVALATDMRQWWPLKAHQKWMTSSGLPIGFYTHFSLSWRWFSNLFWSGKENPLLRQKTCYFRIVSQIKYKAFSGVEFIGFQFGTKWSCCSWRG